MKQFPELHTAQLRLRMANHGDIPALVKYCHNQKISDQIINIPYPYTEQDARERLEFINKGFADNNRYVFAITLQSHHELIGEIGIHLDTTNNHAQMGYWVAEPFWGRGIATEAVGAILLFGFRELGLHKIYATYYPDNTTSGNVMIKNGMVKEAELKDHYRVKDVYKTVFQYRLTIDEFNVLKQ